MNYSVSTLMDDHPLSASIRTKTIEDDSPEESSWTFYMQDFECGGDKDSSFSSGYSLVSDAASSAACGRLDSNNKKAALFASESSNGNKLSFKRPRKAKGAGVSDDLEDTASSPVNSPKTSYMNKLTLKLNDSINKDVSDFNNQGGTNSSHNHDEPNIPEGNIDYSDLRKKGLCLVPASMLAKYFG